MTLFTLRSEAKTNPDGGGYVVVIIGSAASIAVVAFDMTSTKTGQRRAMSRSLTARLFAFSVSAA
jgi:hypothetical protein